MTPDPTAIHLARQYQRQSLVWLIAVLLFMILGIAIGLGVGYNWGKLDGFDQCLEQMEPKSAREALDEFNERYTKPLAQEGPKVK